MPVYPDEQVDMHEDMTKYINASWLLLLVVTACIPESNLVPVGKTPNAVILSRQGQALNAYVLSSDDASLEQIKWAHPFDERKILTLFLPQQTTGTRPYTMDLNNKRFAVALSDTHQVALVDSDSGKVVSTADAKALMIKLETPLHLSGSLDVEGNGLLVKDVTRMHARNPQAIKFVGDQLLVSYGNWLEYARKETKAAIGPGLIALYDTSHNQLELKKTLLLPFQNITQIAFDDNGKPWALAGGYFDYVDGQLRPAGKGALIELVLTGANLQIGQIIDLGLFSAATAIFTAERIYVTARGSNLIKVADRETGKSTELTIPGASSSESISSVAPMGGNLWALAQFSSNRLLVLDAKTDQFNPAPYLDGIPLYAKELGMQGVQAVAIEGNKGIALLSVGSKAVPFDLDKPNEI